jgi:hypothetical protein
MVEFPYIAMPTHGVSAQTPLLKVVEHACAHIEAFATGKPPFAMSHEASLGPKPQVKLPYAA